MTFNQAAVNALYISVVSQLETLGIFETVNSHEPKSAPGSGARAVCWIQSMKPVGAASGLAALSGVVMLNIRIYSNFIQQPQDMIDPDITTATATVMNVFSTGFTLGGTVREIDLLGMYGMAMEATSGYLNQDNRIYRVMTITLPVVINDMFSEVS